jgi:hypothetical protein
MNYFRQHPFITAILTNVILFSTVFAFCFPILNSGDDAYLMYLLGGGFGNAPTELLHYQYGMHPVIGWVIKSAFIQFPNFNWYSFLLYSFHFIACCTILSSSIKKNELLAGLGYYFLFFVIEMFFLLQPSFTNTAMVTAIAGVITIYSAIQQKQTAWRMLPGFVLLLAAALLRLHMLIPVIIIAAPFIVAATHRRQIMPVLLQTLLLGIVITIAFFAQRQYYIKHIPGWLQEEAYRQTVIDNYNVPKKPTNTLKGELEMRADFLENGILWDKDFLSQQQVAATTKATKLRSAAGQQNFRARLFWLLIESRMGILIMLFAFLLKNASLSKKEKITALSSVLLFVGLCAFLILFRKLPGYIVTGGMLQWVAFIILSGSVAPRPNELRPLLIGAVLINLIWGVIRITKINQHNVGQHSYWTCVYNEVSAHKDNLLIVTNDHFPIDYFHVWDLPKKFLLDNVLTKDHFLNNTYQTAFKKFNISSLNDPAKISFIGGESALLEEYYEKKNNQSYDAVPAPQTSNCIKIWGLY